MIKKFLKQKKSAVKKGLKNSTYKIILIDTDNKNKKLFQVEFGKGINFKKILGWIFILIILIKSLIVGNLDLKSFLEILKNLFNL